MGGEGVAGLAPEAARGCTWVPGHSCWSFLLRVSFAAAAARQRRRPRHGPGALPGPAVPALPRRLHLRQEEWHPLRAAHRGAAQRWARTGFGEPRDREVKHRLAGPLPTPGRSWDHH